MSQALSKAGRNTSGIRQYVLAAYYLAAGNLSLTSMGVGAIVIAFGGLVITQYNAVLGPMIAIFGGTIVVVGAIAYTVLWGNRIIAHLSE